MGMTMTQKILARHAGLEHVVPGQLVEGKLDLVLGNDITTPVAIAEFNKAGLTQVFDREKIALVLDHYTPCKDIKAAQLCAQVREFAKRFDITHFYDVGCMGVEHALLPEQGLTAPGEAMIGADSHTCTYGAVNMFSTGVGSTDMAAGMATGLAWFRIPSAIKVTLKGKLQPCVSGKDVILHLIGTIGVDGALYKSLELQLDLVKKRIEHLKLVEQTLSETSKLVKDNPVIDWNKILHLIHITNMEKSLVEQYKNAANINIRIDLHKKYAKNPIGWFPWLYSQLELKDGETVLETGCGNGEL